MKIKPNHKRFLKIYPNAPKILYHLKLNNVAYISFRTSKQLDLENSYLAQLFKQNVGVKLE